MNRQQTIQLCLSIFGAFLLLQATNEAREAKNQADELESRIDQIELVSDDQTLQQKVNDLDLAISTVQGDVEDINRKVGRLEFDLTMEKISARNREY